MKKVKNLSFKINVKERRAGTKKSLPPYLFDRLEAVLRWRCKDTLDHWRKDGWNLSWRCIEESVYQEVFGNDLNYYILGQFLKTGCTWEWRTNKLGYEEPMLVMADKWRKRGPNKRKKRVRK